MATRYQSRYQVEVGDELELWNSAYRASVIGHGRVISTNERGSTVEVLDTTANSLRVGDKVRFNLNTWTDMIILQQRGATFGTGIEGRPVNAS